MWLGKPWKPVWVRGQERDESSGEAVELEFAGGCARRTEILNRAREAMYAFPLLWRRINVCEHLTLAAYGR